MARRPRVSPDRILAAAAAEFADRGFAGARVDRIARRARVNKAMIYYHFKSKQGLYVEILRRVFGEMGDRTGAVASGRGSAPEKLAGFVRAMNASADARPYTPAIMMREIGEDARHLDPDTLRLMARIFGNLRAILKQGHDEASLRDAPPLLTYFSLIAPLFFFRAAAPVRAAMARHHIIEEAKVLTTETFVAHLAATAVQALALPPAPRAPKPRSRRRARPHRSGDHA